VSIGILLSFSASPCVAHRVGLPRFFFVKRHITMVPFSLILLIAVSLLSPVRIRKMALLMFVGGLIAMVMTAIFGNEVKGAKRWLVIFGFSAQPSEFIKPAIAIVVARLLERRQRDGLFPGILLSYAVVGVFLLFLLCQPDIGMTIITIFAFLTQLFIAGMPLYGVISVVAAGISGLVSLYFFVPHVTSRINSFLHPELSDSDQMYQIRQSLDAFHHGSWFGCGPGEGIIKRLVPDAHADFVFAVAGEEYGILMCLLIILLFAFLILRPMMKAYHNKDSFDVFAVTGLAAQLGGQAFVNMATALQLIPTKGMTMPFISYGGSSLLAVSISVGFMLALTRRRYGLVDR
jgi:cell division protein FtsW